MRVRLSGFLPSPPSLCLPQRSPRIAATLFSGDSGDPATLNWNDRRPIRSIYLARDNTKWSSNPRGWFNDPIVQTIVRRRWSCSPMSFWGNFASQGLRSPARNCVPARWQLLSARISIQCGSDLSKRLHEKYPTCSSFRSTETDATSLTQHRTSTGSDGKNGQVLARFRQRTLRLEI
jgi:hypothetical protein